MATLNPPNILARAGTDLTEEQVLNLLRREIAKYPDLATFCRAQNPKLPYSTVFHVIFGTYNQGRGSIPDCILEFLNLKKRKTVTYEPVDSLTLTRRARPS